MDRWREEGGGEGSAAAASVRGGGAAACEGWSRRKRSLSEIFFAFGKVVVVK